MVSDAKPDQKIFTVKDIRMSLLLNVWVKSVRLKEVSWHPSEQNTGFFVFSESLGLCPCLFSDNSLHFGMLGVSWVWSSNLPMSYSPGAASNQQRAQWLPVCPQMSGFQKVACQFCESNTWYKISNYRHQILSARSSETASHSFYFHWKALAEHWPHFTRSDPCSCYLLSARQTHYASLAGWPGNPFPGLLIARNALAGPTRCASAPEVFLRFWQNHCDLPQQRLTISKKV